MWKENTETAAVRQVWVKKNAGLRKEEVEETTTVQGQKK